MELVRRFGESRGNIPAGLGFVEMRVEHDVCAVLDGPPDRFRIAPTLMADGDTKRHRTGLENLPPGTRRIDTVLGGVELDFVLETGDGSMSIDNQCGCQQGAIDDAFGAENNREPSLRGGRCDGGPGAFEKRRVGGRHHLPRSSVAGNEAFWKADETGVRDGRLRAGLLAPRDPLLWRLREPERSQLASEPP